MDEKIRRALMEPFAPEVVKQRQGPNGLVFSYVPVGHYIEALNAAFSHDWSFEVMKREIIEDHIIVEVKLSAGGTVKCGVGGAVITRRREDGRPLSIADDCKRAESDGLKRVCRLMGLGAGLWDPEAVDADEPPAYEPHLGGGVVDGRAAAQPRQARVVPPKATPAHAALPRQAPAPGESSKAAYPANGNGHHGRVTEKQLNYVTVLARKAGLDRDALNTKVFEQYGKRLSYLSSREASSLIADLGGGNGVAGQAERTAGQEG